MVTGGRSTRQKGGNRLFHYGCAFDHCHGGPQPTDVGARPGITKGNADAIAVAARAAAANVRSIQRWSERAVRQGGRPVRRASLLLIEAFLALKLMSALFESGHCNRAEATSGYISAIIYASSAASCRPAGNAGHAYWRQGAPHNCFGRSDSTERVIARAHHYRLRVD